jgi:hypothetical protein
VIGLTDNMAAITAYANDEGYENVFVQQLANFVEPGDIVIAISASGNSPNVIKPLSWPTRWAQPRLASPDLRGDLGKVVSIQLHVPSDIIEQVEDIHLVFEHMIVKALRDNAEQHCVWIGLDGAPPWFLACSGTQPGDQPHPGRNFVPDQPGAGSWPASG